jgi:hypothetical protein
MPLTGSEARTRMSEPQSSIGRQDFAVVARRRAHGLRRSRGRLLVSPVDVGVWETLGQPPTCLFHALTRSPFYVA